MLCCCMFLPFIYRYPIKKVERRYKEKRLLFFVVRNKMTKKNLLHVYVELNNIRSNTVAIPFFLDVCLNLVI